ncbi:MAG: hypothetical protein ACP5LZ_05040 [Fervidicoccaceae archaeon]
MTSCNQEICARSVAGEKLSSPAPSAGGESAESASTRRKESASYVRKRFARGAGRSTQ